MATAVASSQLDERAIELPFYSNTTSCHSSLSLRRTSSKSNPCRYTRPISRKWPESPVGLSIKGSLAPGTIQIVSYNSEAVGAVPNRFRRVKKALWLRVSAINPPYQWARRAATLTSSSTAPVFIIEETKRSTFSEVRIGPGGGGAQTFRWH